MRNKIFTAFMAMFFGLSMQGDVLAENAAKALSVEANLKSEADGRPGITFTVSNISDKTVILKESKLPWGQRYNVVIVAAERKTGSPLKEVSLINDVFYSPDVHIEPGKSLSGSIELTHYVADIQIKRKSSDLVLFWYYHPHGSEGFLGEYGGWLVLPKSGR